MQIIELPAKLAEMFSDLRSAMQTRAEPLESTEDGREILEMVEHASKTIGNELMVFANAIGVRRFNARIFTFEQHKKGKRKQWQLCDVQPAAPEFLSGGAGSLRALMRGAMSVTEGKTIAVWVNAMPVSNEQVFFALALHQNGLEAAFAIGGRHWSPLSLGEASLEMTLGVMLSRPSAREGSRWDAMIRAQIEVMRDDLREDMAEFLKSEGGSDLTDERWEELLHLIYGRRNHLVLMQEVARSCGTGLVHECQKILGAMVHLIDTALEGNSEKMASIEKTHARALKRFQTDLLKFKSGRDVATNRLKVVEKELLGLKKQLKDVGAGHQPQLSEGSIGTALDRFFV